MKSADLGSDLDHRASAILRRSKISTVFTIIFVAAIALSTYYFSNRISALSAQIDSLDRDIDKKRQEIEELNKLMFEKDVKLKELHAVEEETKLRVKDYSKALTELQEGTRYLVNRQYGDAVESFQRFLDFAPESPEALNFLGYAEHRYAQFWRENSRRTDIDEEQKQEFSKRAADYLHASVDHLRRSRVLRPDYAWPLYNLALAQYYGGAKSEALSTLSEMLSTAPQMVKWLCDDGQFRPMRLSSSTQEKFTKVVTDATKLSNRASCWVTKAPI